MKKILYTLFAFAIIVACEKDMDDNYNVDSISPIEELNATVEISHDDAFAFLNSIVESGDFDTPAKGSVSTEKAGDFGDNWIQVMYFDYTFLQALGQRPYALVVSDDNSVACPATQMLNVQEVSYSLRPRVIGGTPSPVLSDLIIETISATGTVSSSRAVSSAGWANAFASNFDRVYPANTGRTSIAGGPAPTRATFDTTCNSAIDYSTYYTVTPAPFPLTGFLATLNSNAPAFTGSAANYAGTTRESVETAIENDIRDGN